ncbi:hypothetical protein CYR81_00310 [Enterococcus faecalis]|nr:hypothetical protein [Enterococcus faecalis]EGO9445371.1 hypothetical protein [Enterococcus faecalis]OFA14600.1 hypothetical protein ENFAE_00980 [Enterococcus faecalis]PLA82081.1 hypothetical protein CYR81_00310 [Enterococcus faecalis]
MDLKKGVSITFSVIGSYFLQLPSWLYALIIVFGCISFMWYTWINAPEHYWKSYDKRHTKRKK